MYPSRFRYEAPRSLDEAIGTLRDGGDYAKILAGGQSLVPMMKLRFASPTLLVSLGKVPGLGGKMYGRYSGFCLEDQAFPDAVHHPHFPNIIITPDKPYSHWCEFEIA